MAKIEIIAPAIENRPESVECIEVQALEEHGYFKVLKAQNVTTAKEAEERIARWRQSTQEDYEKRVKDWPAGVPAPAAPDLSNVPQNLAYCYALIARREPGQAEGM